MHFGIKVASTVSVKVLLSADHPTARSARRGVSSAKAVTIRTMPFSVWMLVVWVVAIGGAGGLIYWIGADRFRISMEQEVFEVSGLEIGVVGFAVGALCWLVTQCWKYFDPYPEVRISPGAAQLGTSFDVEWKFCGSKGRLRALAIALEGREEVMAENKAGKQARAQKLTAPFYVEELDVPERIKEGNIHVPLPEGLMPTFECGNTKILWVVRFESRIKWAATMRYEFPVRVLAEAANG